MSSPQSERTQWEPESQRTGAHPVWYIALIIALVAIIGLFLDDRHISTDLADVRQSSQEQIARLNDQLAQKSAEIGQRTDAVAQEVRESTKAAADHAESALRRSSATLTAKLEEQGKAAQDAQQAVTNDLNDLKQATASRITEISSDVNGVKGEVGSVKTDLATTESEVQQHGTELKRMTGDLGVVSDRIATNQKELAELRELGQRNYVEFDVTRKSGLKKVGNIQLALAKADPKRSRFTLRVLADDKTVEKSDRTINEPVQLYVSGNRLPYEIVVNAVKKDEVVGYVAIPKVTAARSTPTANSQ